MNTLRLRTIWLFVSQTILALLAWAVVSITGLPAISIAIAWYVPVLWVVGTYPIGPYPHSDPIRYGSVLACGFAPIGVAIFGAAHADSLSYLQLALLSVAGAGGMGFAGLIAAEIMACDALNAGVRESKKRLMLLAFPFGIGIVARLTAAKAESDLGSQS